MSSKYQPNSMIQCHAEEIIIELTKTIEKEVHAFEALVLSLISWQNKKVRRQPMVLESVIKIVKKRYSARLRALRYLLIQFSSQTQHLNLRNQDRIENALHFIDQSMTLLLPEQPVVPEVEYSEIVNDETRLLQRSLK